MVILALLVAACTATTNIPELADRVARSCGEHIKSVDIHEFPNRIVFTHTFLKDINTLPPGEQKVQAYNVRTLAIQVHQIIAPVLGGRLREKPFGYVFKDGQDKIFCQFFFEDEEDDEPQGVCHTGEGP